MTRLCGLCLAAEHSTVDFAGYANLAAPSDSADVVPMLPGIAEPGLQVTLSAPLDGVLMDILVREGDVVEAGQIVAIMDNRVSRAELQLAEALYARTTPRLRAELDLKLAENVLARLMAVGDRLAVSELELDQARGQRDLAATALEQAKEQSSEAKAQCALAQARLEAHNIRAPFSGQVLRIDRHGGETLAAAEAVLALANLQTLRAELYVPVRWFRQLTVGAEYRLAAAPPLDRPLPAQLVASEPKVDAATQSFRCVFEIDNAKGELPAGFAVKLMQPDGADRGQP
jgi:RND family efflux transporter MFP subunit